MNTIAELFDKTPEDITPEERKVIIEQYRNNRHLFMSGQKQPKASTTPTVIGDDNMVELD